MRIVASFLMGVLVLSIQGCYAEKTAVTLDSSIKPAQTEQISKIRQGKDWRNPWVMIYDNGVALSWGYPRQGKSVKCERLAEELAALPVSAWPYGRMISVQECGISGGGRQAEQYRKRAWDCIKTVSKRLDILVNAWPSA